MGVHTRGVGSKFPRIQFSPTHWVPETLMAAAGKTTKGTRSKMLKEVLKTGTKIKTRNATIWTKTECILAWLGGVSHGGYLEPAK